MTRTAAGSRVLRDPGEPFLLLQPPTAGFDEFARIGVQIGARLLPCSASLHVGNSHFVSEAPTSSGLRKRSATASGPAASDPARAVTPSSAARPLPERAAPSGAARAAKRISGGVAMPASSAATTRCRQQGGRHGERPLSSKTARRGDLPRRAAAVRGREPPQPVAARPTRPAPGGRGATGEQASPRAP
jgi:hypothetical protein